MTIMRVLVLTHSVKRPISRLVKSGLMASPSSGSSIRISMITQKTTTARTVSIVETCDLLMRGLAHIGIVTLLRRRRLLRASSFVTGEPDNENWRGRLRFTVIPLGKLVESESKNCGHL